MKGTGDTGLSMEGTGDTQRLAGIHYASMIINTS